MRVLIVSEGQPVGSGLDALLSRARHDMALVRSVSDALQALRTSAFDLVLVEQVLEARLRTEAAESGQTLPVFAFLPAAFSRREENARLSPAVASNTSSAHPHGSRFASARPRLRKDSAAPLELPSDIVAVDPRTRHMLERVRSIAEANITVLVTGETGVGKEMVARSIHRFSARRYGPFVPVNCGAIPETLVESELFGHRKGAFTGAVDDRRGLIAEADKGVLFLDEIGELPLGTQAALLRFLDRGEVRRVGETAIHHVRTRVIAATNRRLEEEVRAGRFREDLFYRLSVARINVPPLRDRPYDIVPLATHHLQQTAARAGKSVRGFTPEAEAQLLAYAWPGNIRELQNAVEVAVVVAPGDLIAPSDLPDAIVAEPAGGGTQAQAALAPKAKELLDLFGGNRSRAAAALGISRTTLWRKLRNMGDRALA